jgi:hypothetical protein
MEGDGNAAAASQSLYGLFAGADIRVWTQLHHCLMANKCSIARKFWLSFSNRVASLRISFILQKNRSTTLRMA